MHANAGRPGTDIEEGPAAGSGKGIWRRRLARLLLLIVLGGVFLFIWKDLRAIRAYEFVLRWPLLAASFLVAIVTYLVNYAVWLKLAAAFSLHAGWRQSSYAWFVSQLGKYVPGKITMLIVRMNAYAGQPKRKIAAASGIEFLASVAASSVVVLVGVACSPTYFGVEARVAALSLLIVLLIALYPPVLLAAMNFLLVRLKREPIAETPTYGLILTAVALYALNGLIAGVWAFFLFNALTPLDWNYYLVLTASCYGASLIGFAVLFAPGGIGVREGILFLILPLFMPKPAVIVGTILMRLLVIVVELALAAAAAAAFRFGGGNRTGVRSTDSADGSMA